MTNYQYRDRNDQRGSYPKCRQTYEIRYLAGASMVNPNMDVQLCDKHEKVYCDERDELFMLHTQLGPKRLKFLWEGPDNHDNEEN